MKWSDFMVYVQAEAPGCPAFIAERAVRDAAIELCRQTDVYKDEPHELILAPGETSYDLDAPAGTEVNRVLSITRDGVELTALPNTMACYALIGNDSTHEKPNWFGADDNTAVMVARTPAEKESLKLFQSLKPSATSTSIPDGIGKQYRKQIVTGAISNLLLMNGQPWSNPQLGLLLDQRFHKEIAAIIRQIKFGFSGASIRVKSRPFI